MKNESGRDVYIILLHSYLYFEEWQPFRDLTAQEVGEYYNLNYLNRISNSRTEYGVETPLYWVI